MQFHVEQCGAVSFFARSGNVKQRGGSRCKVSGAWDRISPMLFMVIEGFRDGDPRPIGARFREKGRMLPEGVAYHASWVDAVGMRCFQVMEATNAESLVGWIRCWDDLVDFEVVPVLQSAEFWSQIRTE